MKRLLLAIASLSMVAASGMGVTALAAPPSPDNPKGPSTDILGVVHAKNAAKAGSAGGNLGYHGGPVMHTNTTYAIYWVPSGYSMQSGYDAVINQFLGDVAHDNGLTSDVYWSDTQYSDSSGLIASASTFGGSVVDTSPYPASGCADSVAQTTVCLSDSQLRAEIDRVMTQTGWTRGPTSLVFMFTAKGVGSCYSSNSCAFSSYCAYHSNLGTGTAATPYANQPYASTVTSACDAGEHPNNNEADATINVASHEHNEAITDPFGNAWYDKRGYENGDKCAWNFGAALGTAGSRYNQVINNHHYYLQQEWSNKTSRCVLQGL